MRKNTIDFELGEILMVFRQRAHLSKREVAKHVKVTPATISNYEASRTVPSYRKMLKFKRIFGGEFDDVLGIIGEGGGHFHGHIF